MSRMQGMDSRMWIKEGALFLIVLALVVFSAVVIIAPLAYAGGSVKIEEDGNMGGGSGGLKVFTSDSITLKAIFDNTPGTAKEGGTDNWKWWTSKNYDVPEGNAPFDPDSLSYDDHEKRTFSSSQPDKYTVYARMNIGKESDNSNPTDSKQIEFVQGNVMLETNEDVVEADEDEPPTVTLTATLDGPEPPENVIYAFYAGNSLIHDSDPIKDQSYEIDLSSPIDMEYGDIYGETATASRFRVEILTDNDPPSAHQDYPLPTDSGGIGGPFDEANPPVANESDIVWGSVDLAFDIDNNGVIDDVDEDNEESVGIMLAVNAPKRKGETEYQRIQRSSGRELEYIDWYPQVSDVKMSLDDGNDKYEVLILDGHDNFWKPSSDHNDGIDISSFNGDETPFDSLMVLGKKAGKAEMELDLKYKSGDISDSATLYVVDIKPHFPFTYMFFGHPGDSIPFELEGDVPPGTTFEWIAYGEVDLPGNAVFSDPQSRQTDFTPDGPNDFNVTCVLTIPIPGESSKTFSMSKQVLVLPSPNNRNSWNANVSGSGLQGMGAINAITLHHSDRNMGDVSDASQHVLDIQNSHINDRGWPDIGYHYLISRNGGYFEGLQLEGLGLPGGPYTKGSHVGGNNTAAGIGVCMMADFQSDPLSMSTSPSDYDGSHDVTDALVNDVAAFLTALCWRYDLKSSDIKKHNDFSSTACPGNKFVPRFQDVKDKVKDWTEGEY